MGANRFSYQSSEPFAERLAALIDHYGVRGLERRVGVTKATLSRASNGHEFDLATAQVLGTLTGICPCCSRRWPKGSSHAR